MTSWRMEFPLLAALSDDQRRAVLAVARRRRFDRGEVTPLGDTATLNVLGPGDYFGERAVVSPAPRSATVVALEPTETPALHRDELDELRRRERAIERVLLDALANEMRRVSRQLLEALYVPVEQRLFLRLLDRSRS